MAANEARARLIKETSLMQVRGEGGGETQHMLDCNQNNKNK